MQPKKSRLYVFTFLFAILSVCYPELALADISCDTVPISLSNITQCTGSTCSFTEITTISLSAQPGQQACLTFVSPDESVSTTNLTIINRGMYFVYTPDYTYYSSDGNFTAKASCLCPGHAAPTCSSCPASDRNTDLVLCRTGSVASKDCIGNYVNVQAQWCATLSFDLYPHFGIIRYLPQPRLIGQMDFIIDNTIYPFYYEGTSLQSLSFAPNFQATIDVNTAEHPPVEFGVYDIIDRSDILLLDSSNVNSLNSADPRKFGHIKADQIASSIDSSLINSFDFLFSSEQGGCEPDAKFSVKSTLINQHDLFNQNQNKRLGILSPGSFVTGNPLIIPTNPPSSSYFSHPHYVGLMVQNYYGLQSIGFDQNFRLSKIVATLNHTFNTFSAPGVVTTTTGLWEMDAMKFDCNQTQTCYLLLAQRILPSGPYDVIGWQLCTESEYINFVTNPETYICSNWQTSFVATLFPSQNEHLVSIESLIVPGTSYALNFTYTNNFTSPTTDQELHVATTGGDLLLTLSFSNLTVSFVSTSVKPKILSATVNSTGWSNVCLMSLTVKGDCYLSTSPMLVQAQPVLITTQKECSDYPPNTVSLNGETTLILTCRNYQDKKTVIANFNNNPNVIPATSEDDETNNSPSDFINPMQWDVSTGFIIGKIAVYVAVLAFAALLLISAISCFIVKRSAPTTWTSAAFRRLS